MRKAEYKDKFIGYIDILGFKNFVKSSESGGEPSLDKILGFKKALESLETKIALERSGPSICPCSKYIERNLDFEISQVSDCSVVSSEISPAGIINLVNHCSSVVIGLMLDGVMCRGYISRGKIYHKGNDFIGTGYMSAYENESNVQAFKRHADDIGTPFVEIDNNVIEYVRACNDECVIEMFSRVVKEDEGYAAIFPFKRLGHSFIAMGGPLETDLRQEKMNNIEHRLGMKSLKKRILNYVDDNNVKAVKKVEYYLAAIDEQIHNSYKIDEIIEKLGGPSVLKKYDE